MSTPHEVAQKMLQDAILSFKNRARDAAMALPPLAEHDEERRTFILQFNIADDVAKTIAAQLQR